MADGNGPQPTSPLYATDEHIAIHAMGDFAILCPPWQVVASGADGSFASDDLWTLTSGTVDFESQGVAAQNVVLLTTPRANFGTGHLFAADSVSGNSVTLRRIGGLPGKGQPPSPPSGISGGVAFEFRTLGPQIDEATYRIKDRYSIDEMIYSRSSDWLYQGVEDPYRVFRDVAVFTVLSNCYESQMRDQTENGDFARKAKRYKIKLGEAIDLLQARWGPMGNSQAPTNLFGCKAIR